MDLRVPSTPFQAVNQYIVGEQIGGGGMGTVFRAFDVQLKRHVALKVLNSLDQDSLERFVREREITADLDHPNFVRVLSMGYLSTEEGRRPFYTMPLIRGETIGMMIRRRARPDEEGERLREEFTLHRLLQLVQQLCLALESAHDIGIIHRDLKPANVVIGPYGELYIVDLGLAKYFHEGDEPVPGGSEARARAWAADEAQGDLTSKSAVGTPYFMAPEQILNPASVDARTDIFGLGAILYYILTADRPLYRSHPETRSGPIMGDGAAGVETSLLPRPRPSIPDSSGSAHKASAFARWEEEKAPPSSRADILMQALRDDLIPPDHVVATHQQEIEARHAEGPALERIDAALSAICMKALARKPEDRYQTCRAMWQELQQYLEGRLEMVLKREAADLTRRMSKGTLPTALRDYELAEGRLRERIVEKESVGRLGLEEKLDLFDLLLEKAKIYEIRGDSDSITRAVTRAEPIIETALEVLHRQLVQLLIAKGFALSDQGEVADAKAIFARALEVARLHKLDDLTAAAGCGYGVACGRSGKPADAGAAREALEDSIQLADRLTDIPQRVRSRVSLARLDRENQGKSEAAKSLLEEALRIAGTEPSLLCEVHLALGFHHMGRKEASLAHRYAEAAARYAEKVDAQNLIREAHFLLGQAWHALRDPARRAEHFKLALRVRGPRRTSMETRISDFYRKNALDPAEIGLRIPRESTRRSSPDPAPLAAKASSLEKRT
ncbi:MAG TPA: serine/threonine-protein kinase [Planctomycetota bacterium]|nr:serine/threonine-protein kinase [Planctomycetota bacterium]